MEEFCFGQVECEVVPGCPGRDKAAGLSGALGLDQVDINEV